MGESLGRSVSCGFFGGFFIFVAFDFFFLDFTCWNPSSTGSAFLGSGVEILLDELPSSLDGEEEGRRGVCCEAREWDGGDERDRGGYGVSSLPHCEVLGTGGCWG